MEKRVLVLTGPTACGKTAIALEWASRHDAEIVNADSILFYRQADIGSAKPTTEERHRVPHHLIDLISPDESFTAGDFFRSAEKSFAEIHSRGKTVLVVGGSGFYLKALLYGLWDAGPADHEFRATLENRSNAQLYEELSRSDAEFALKITPGDRYRLIRALEIIHTTGQTPSQHVKKQASTPRPEFQLLVLDRPNEELKARIRQRASQMLEHGFVEEVKRIREKHPRSRILRAVGYRQVCDHLDGKLPDGRKIRPGLEGLADEIELAHRQLVKRQRTWFRGQKIAEWFELEKDYNRLVEKMDS